MTISGGRTEQLDIFCRVTGFKSDFLSFIVVEHIRFFHGSLQLLVNRRRHREGRLIDMHHITCCSLCTAGDILVWITSFTFVNSILHTKMVGGRIADKHRNTPCSKKTVASNCSFVTNHIDAFIF